MADIITLGELLIDLTQKGADENGYGQFTAYPGGAPANVAVAAARLGARTAFIGKVGDDSFGRSLAETLEKEGVYTVGLAFDDEVPTTMAIVAVDPTGERTFSFYRNPGADTQLTEDEAAGAIQSLFFEAVDKDVSEITISDIKALPPEKTPLILHVGSLSLTNSPSKEACMEAVKYAKSLGMLISYDPNYRDALWDSEERAIEEMKSLIPYADILKVSDDELKMLAGTGDFEEGSRILQRLGREESEEAFLVMVTLGEDGVFVRCGDFCGTIPGFSVKVADTNGAGDTFLGAMLMQIAEHIRKEDSRNVCMPAPAAVPLEPVVIKRKLMLDDSESIGMTEDKVVNCFSRSRIKDMVTYANKAASVTCSRSGAIPAMPSADEVSL